jgi:hypothetical protein
MAVAEIALIVVAFGAMAIVFGAQERAEERRILAWAEETLARLAATARVVEPAATGDPATGDTAARDTAAEAPAPPPRELVDAA